MLETPEQTVLIRRVKPFSLRGAVATFYGEAGQVIYTDYTYTDPSDIPAGQSAPFELMVTDEDISENIESVKLSAQSKTIS